MINIISIVSVVLTLACSFTAIGAASVPALQSRNIFSPPILYPNAATVWFAGQRHNVTWNASNPPKLISNRASIVLRTVDPRGRTPVTLASDFSLLDGTHEIKVPSDVPSRDDWIITLFGDSGNVSPPFTILA